MASAGISRLPVEMIQQVLLALTDIKTLKSVILSSSIFYGPFKGLERKVIEEVTRRDFTPGLLRLAMIIEVLARVEYSEVGDLRACLGEYLDLSHGNNISLSMREFNLLLSQKGISLHAIVGTLCWVDGHVDGFARSQLKGEYNQDQSLSQNERNRIRHGIYRVAIYSLLSARFEHPTEFEYCFLAMFSVWENEELFRISKYLERFDWPDRRSGPRFRAVLSSSIASSILHALLGSCLVDRGEESPEPFLELRGFDQFWQLPPPPLRWLPPQAQLLVQSVYPAWACTLEDSCECVWHRIQSKPSFRLRHALKQIVVLWDQSRLKEWGIFSPFTERTIRPLTVEDLNDNNGDDAR